MSGLQIIGEGKGRKKFISLFTSFFGSETVLKDVNYLHSPGSKFDLSTWCTWCSFLIRSISSRQIVLALIVSLFKFSAADDLKPVTHLLAVNVTSKEGIKLLHEGVNYLVMSTLLSYEYSLLCNCIGHYFKLCWCRLKGQRKPVLA